MSDIGLKHKILNLVPSSILNPWVDLFIYKINDICDPIRKVSS